MAAVVVMRRATGKSHPTQVTEDDTILVGGLELGSIGATSVSLYTDDNVTAINIGGGANSPPVTIGDSATTTTIPGDLVVQGTTTSIDSEVVNIADNHLYLNKDYVTTVAQTGGLVVNYLPTSTNDTSASGGFDSTTTVNTTGASTFSAGDFIQFSGSDNAANDGLYEVLTHAANVLTIDSTPVHSFAQTALTVDTGDTTAVIRQVTVSALQAGTDGVWETGAGSTAGGLTFVDLGSGGGNSLDAAYAVGNSITMTDADGDFAVSVTSGTPAITLDAAGASNFTVASAALTLSTTTSGTLSVSGAAVVDIDAATALSINSSGGAINIGNDDVDQAINIGTQGERTVSISNGAFASTVNIGNATGASAVNIDSGTGGVTIDAVATADISLTVPADAGSDIFLSAHGQQHPFNTAAIPTLTTTAQSIVSAINEADDEAIAAAAAAAAAESNTWGDSLGNGATSGGVDPTLTTGDSLVGADELTMVSTTTGAVVIDSGTTGPVSLGVDASNAKTVTIGATATSSTTTVDCGTGGANFGTSANAHATTVGSTNSTSSLTLQSGTGAMTLTAGGIFDLNATGAITLDGTTMALTPTSTFDLQATGAITIDSSGASISIGADDNDFDINIGTQGERTVNISTGAFNSTLAIGTGAAVMGVTLGSLTTTSALTLQSGATGDITFDANNMTTPLPFNGTTSGDAGDQDLASTFTATTLIGLLNELKGIAGGDRLTETYTTTGRTVGEVVIIDGNDSAATQADASALSTTEGFVGVVQVVAASGEVVTLGTATALFENGTATPAAGDPIYLSETAGRVTGVVPTGNPNSGVVVWPIAVLKSDSGLTATTIGTDESAQIHIQLGDVLVL